MSKSSDASATIEKLIVRGAFENPEILEVIGLTDKRQEIKVRFIQDGIENPEDNYTPSPKSQFASIIAGEEEELDQAFKLAPITLPYHGVGSTKEKDVLWSAKFFMDDHPNLTRLWQEFCRIANINDKTVIKVETVDALPEKAISFNLENIVSGFPYDLGVLFVHGIGSPSRRETLVNFGEPILGFWKRLLNKATEKTVKNLDKDTRNAFYNKVISSRLVNRVDLDGISKILSDFYKNKDKTENSNLSKKAIENVTGFRCGTLRVKDTAFESTFDERMPASTLVRLSSLNADNDSSCSLKESHILLSEASWADKVVPYSFAELVIWVNKVIPVIIRLELNTSWNAARATFESRKLLSAVYGLFCVISAVFIFVTIPFKLIFAVLLWPILLLVSLLNLIPFSFVKEVSRKLIDVLIGTVGQSHVLKGSAIRRSAITSSVESNLDWMLEKCEEVVVVAHSQGAEISRLVIQAKRYDRLKRIYSFGSGIKPLSILETDEFSKEKHWHTLLFFF